jgi:pyruvate/2-oxoglutarate dehydrogenase complex dihydrolipoamide acyltransferase (E2) component
MTVRQMKYVGTHAQDLPSGRMVAPGEVLDDVDDDEVKDLLAEGKLVYLDELEEEGPNATEAAIALAAEKGINLTEIRGTGKDGSVTKDDVADHISKHGDPTEEGGEKA